MLRKLKLFSDYMWLSCSWIQQHTISHICIFLLLSAGAHQTYTHSNFSRQASNHRCCEESSKSSHWRSWNKWMLFLGFIIISPLNWLYIEPFRSAVSVPKPKIIQYRATCSKSDIYTHVQTSIAHTHKHRALLSPYHFDSMLKSWVDYQEFLNHTEIMAGLIPCDISSSAAPKPFLVDDQIA